MITLPIHRSGIHFSKHYDCAFVHKDHPIVELWKQIKRRTDAQVAHLLVDDTHFKFTKRTAETLCLHFALPSLVRLQRWFRATLRLRRRLAVVMALHPRLGRARTPPPLGPVRMRVCRLACLKEDLVIKVLSIVDGI